MARMVYVDTSAHSELFFVYLYIVIMQVTLVSVWDNFYYSRPEGARVKVTPLFFCYYYFLCFLCSEFPARLQN